MTERSDAMILVMGPRGKVGAGRLLSAGKKVAVVEKNFCGAKAATGLVSRKTLIRPRQARNEAKRTQGTNIPSLGLKDIFDYRGPIIRNLNGSVEVESYEQQAARIVKAI